MAERKVLIIDDDDALLPMLKTAFKRYQFDVHVTSDGADGLEMARKHGHDLVLLSVELPVGNGFLVCKEFKQDPKLKDIPVIITSRKATDADFEKHRKLKVRANDYLHKPFTDEELFAKVGNVVGFALSPDEFSELEAKVHDFLEERTKLESEISDKADRIAELEAELDAVKKGGKDAAKVEKRLADAEERIAELNAAVAERDDKVATAEAAVIERDARIAELENDIGAQASESQAAKDESGKKDKQIAKLEAALSEKDERVSALEAAVDEKDGRLAELELNAGSLTERLDAAEARAEKFSGKVEALEARERELQGELEQLKAREQELSGQAEQAEGRANDLEGQVAQLQAQLRELGDAKDTLEETLAGTRKLVASAVKALGCTEEDLADAARHAKAESERVLKLDEELADLKAKQSTVEAELAETRKSLEKEAKKRTKLREVLEKAITTLD